MRLADVALDVQEAASAAAQMIRRANYSTDAVKKAVLYKTALEQNPEMIERMTKLVPFRRLGTPEEQADVVSFLLSDDARWITGQVISTSGGLTMC